ncbi:MAG: PAS domain-containing protein, partial [Candidatus Thorarchaeota archaeon]
MSELPWTSTIQVNRLFDLLDEGLVVLDNAGVIVHSNQTFADFLQYSAGDLVDRRFEDLVSENERGALASYLSDTRGLPLSLSLTTSLGEKKLLDIKALSLVEDELPRGFCLVITESGRIEMSFERIIDGAFLRFMTIDPKLNVSYVNRAYGKGTSDIIGKSVLDTVAPAFRSDL